MLEEMNASEVITKIAEITATIGVLYGIYHTEKKETDAEALRKEIEELQKEVEKLKELANAPSDKAQ